MKIAKNNKMLIELLNQPQKELYLINNMLKLIKKEKTRVVYYLILFLVRISDVQTLIITRESDLKAYSDRLRSENNNYSANLKIHDDIVVRYYFL